MLGLPAMQRIQGAKVLLSGLQGLGAEVAKNLVLMGVGSLTLHGAISCILYRQMLRREH